MDANGQPATEWRGLLEWWLRDNPRDIPPKLEALRQEFVARFPRERLRELTLKEYAVGHAGSKESFCYWLEWRTEELGSVKGGSSFKWGVWWSQASGGWSYNLGQFSDAEDARRKLLGGVGALLDAAADGRYEALDSIGDKQLGPNRNSLRAKPLSLYFPQAFLPISNPDHLANALRRFGLTPEKGLHASNRQLLDHLRRLPEFDDVHPVQIMHFLYDNGFDKGPFAFGNGANLAAAIEAFGRFAHSEKYHSEEYDYKKALLDELGPVLQELVAGAAEPGLARLREVARAQVEAANNLVTWQAWDKFRAYLEKVPPAEVKEQLAALLDEQGDVVERIDGFREAVESSTQRALGKAEPLPLNLVSLLLMAHAPDDHIIYRRSLIDRACVDWGAPKISSGQRNDGVKYAQTLSLVLPLRERLTPVLGRPADLIDVHTLLYFNEVDTYNEFKVTDAGHAERDGEGPITDPELPPFLQQLLASAARTRNIILYGPPGTGKTYWVRQLQRRFDGREAFVTFHQSFGYEDFIEGIRPGLTVDDLRYRLHDGAFKRMCDRAAEDPDNEYLFVIDEINRANIAKVFGELITLLEDDKRLGEPNEVRATLPYSGDSFGVPGNLLVVGTMNTADRSIALLDIALRRRFTFVHVAPDASLLPTVSGVDLGAVLRRLNSRIAALLDGDHAIGHSYFLGVKTLEALRFAWDHRVLPLLQEYFYNDAERLAAVVGRDFLEAPPLDKASEVALGDLVDPDAKTCRPAALSDEAFLAALRELAK